MRYLITTNCSNCKYREFACGYVPCKDFFYLKDEEVESRIKELEATIENMKAIAINLQQPIQGYTTTSVDLIDDNTTELISELEDYYGLKTNILKTKCCGIAPITTENYCPNCGRKIKK